MCQHILFFVEFNKGTYIAEKKINELSKKFQSKISLVGQDSFYQIAGSTAYALISHTKRDVLIIPDPA